MSNFIRKIFNSITLFRKRKTEHDKEDEVYVDLKWDDHFTPSYVRRIKSIRMHQENNYGHVEDSVYLEDAYLYNKQRYKNKELFIVREGDWFGGILSGLTVTIEEMEKKCRYYLVQIDAGYPNGFQNIGFVYQNNTYPWHENELVKIIVENKLHQYIRTEN